MADTQTSPTCTVGSAAPSTSAAEDETGGPAATRAADAAAVQRLTAYRRALEATATYAVGALVVEARESLGAALALPWRLLRLHRHHRHLERLASGTGSKTATKAGVGSAAAEFKALSVVAGDDTAKTIKALRAQGGELRSQARALAVAAERLAETAPQQAVALAREAWACDPAPECGRRLAFILYRCGAIAEPNMLFARSDIARDASPAVRREAEKVTDEDRLLREGISLPTRRARLFSTARGGPPRALYVAHLTLPHHRSGYAVRTHETLRALGREGIEAICVSRPGYPWDRSDAHNVGAARLEQQIDSVRYRRIADVSLPYTPLSRFVEAAAKVLATEIDAFQPDAVIAGSNHVNALPALIAARRAGLPFFYDVRGIWEHTTAAKRPDWERSERFALARRLETQTACEADGVFAISGAVREALADRGVPAERISLAPNGVDPARFDGGDGARIRAQMGIPPEAVVYGFIGSMEAYEGLDVLMDAFARVVRERDDRFLLLVGGGPDAQRLHDQAAALGVIGKVRLPGRVPFDEIRDWYAAGDVFVYPRRNLPVCALVPPLKPLEAMAAGRAVVVSNLPPLVEVVGGETQARVVSPDNTSALALVMASLARDVDARTTLADKAQRFVMERRRWHNALSSMTDAVTNWVEHEHVLRQGIELEFPFARG